MTCQFDEYDECQENCPDCVRYKPHCKVCGGEIEELSYDGMCFECFIEKKSEKLDEIKNFLLDDDEARENYKDYLRDLYG